MRKFKSVFAAVLCLCMSMVALTGCGGGEFDAEQPITVIVRPNTSGTRTAFMELIGLKGKDDPTGVITADGTPAVLAEVAGNPQAIAYESLGYCTDAVKILKIDGVEATVENIQNGSYAISRPLSVIYKATTLENALFAAYNEFLMSEDAQVLIAQEGYVSVNTGTAYQKSRTLTGEIRLNGSTSLTPLMEVLAETFESYHVGVTVTVAGTGSGAGRTAVNGGTCDFGMISDEFSATDEANGLTQGIVAKDGIAVIVHKSNTYSNLTTAQIKNIYARETEAPYTKWSDIQ